MTQTPTDALRLVPVEPTEAMLTALRDAEYAAEAHGHEGGLPMDGLYIQRRAYSALLAAAPASPLPGGGDEALIAELKEARGLLEPFAREAESWPELADSDTLAMTAPDGTASAYDVKMKDIRATRAFLARNGKGEG